MPRYVVMLARVTYAYATQEIDAEDAAAAEAAVSESLALGELNLEWQTDDVDERVLFAEEPAPPGP